MRYDIPLLQLGILCPPQTQIEDKFGGLPWGMPADVWPVCRSCGHTMGLLAQFVHHNERLNLGREGRSLFVFMCCNADTFCGGYFNPEDGGNCSFVLEPEQLTTGLTMPPDAPPPELIKLYSSENCCPKNKRNPSETLWIYTEARVIGWAVKDDGISEEMRSYFLSETEFNNVDNELFMRVYPETKLGSVPSWIQYPECEEWLFVGQIDEVLRFSTPLPTADEVGCAVYVTPSIEKNEWANLLTRLQNEMPTLTPDEISRIAHKFIKTDPILPKIKRFDGPSYVSAMKKHPDNPHLWACNLTIFGDAGCGYLFIKSNGDIAPEARFIVQCS